jgi:adenylate kinase
MARKKVRTKKAGGKKNPLAAMKTKLAKLSSDLKAIQAKVSDASKRAAAAKKAAPKKKARKKRAAKKKA